MSARASSCNMPGVPWSARSSQNTSPTPRQLVPQLLSKLSSSGRQRCGTEEFPESLESLLFGGSSSSSVDAPLGRSKGDLSTGDTLFPELLSEPTAAPKRAAWENPDTVDPGRPYSLSLRLGAGFGGLLRDALEEDDDDDDSPTSMGSHNAEASQQQTSTMVPETCQGD